MQVIADFWRLPWVRETDKQLTKRSPKARKEREKQK